MKQRKRIRYSEGQKAEMWDRWQKGKLKTNNELMGDCWPTFLKTVKHPVNGKIAMRQGGSAMSLTPHPGIYDTLSCYITPFCRLFSCWASL
jgi:hypothetical protein